MRNLVRCFALAGVALLCSGAALTCERPPTVTFQTLRSRSDGVHVWHEVTATYTNRLDGTAPSVVGTVSGTGQTVAVEPEILIGPAEPNVPTGTPDTFLVRAPVGVVPTFAVRWLGNGQRNRTAAAALGASGGVVDDLEPGAAGAQFGGFVAGTWAQVLVTDQPWDRDLLAETGALARVGAIDRLGLRVRVGAAPTGATVRVWFRPETAPTNQVLWARIPSGAPAPSADLDTFEPVATNVDWPGHPWADIPASAFKQTSPGVFDAIVLAAVRVPYPVARAAGDPVQHRCPVAIGCTVTSAFAPAREHPVLGTTRPHLGVDYRAPEWTQINASAAGVVERSYRSTSFGETVIVRHPDGSGTLYAHLSRRDVFVGDAVAQGEQLGWSGATGLARGPHLHFELVRSGAVIGGARIDPVTIVVLPRPIQIRWVLPLMATDGSIAGTLDGVWWDISPLQTVFPEPNVVIEEFYWSTLTVSVYPGTYRIRIGWYDGSPGFFGVHKVVGQIQTAGVTWRWLGAPLEPGLESVTPTQVEFGLAPYWGSGMGHDFNDMEVIVP